MSDILITAFALSVVLVGIHAFFGTEIIRRGIIFTDLAIGQMAALGAAASLFFIDGQFVYPISLGFALAGGLLIAWASRHTDNLEAFIGLMYAFGISAVYIILSKSAHGMEEFQRLMASDILFTPQEEVVKTAIIYAVLGVVLFALYRRIDGFWKDALFFVSFAVTVTSSVKLAGVLIVFALLVAPALIAIRVGGGRPLVVAWIVGTLVNLVAIALAHRFDFPTGYTIVFCNALLALLVTIIPRRAKRG
ncbi:MAG TPA: metal ABC transporter permease [Spirochaetota bacterium]|nr:metal ABC transporter permease [Spirochaetota bacterium]HNT13200.1 metal ABC transporter permease [Spirochaetota bacterium]HNV46701.1 metal ABC transporter permease [Spirochaetota bacterium]HOS39051.1 metal ABC transporter permease [Spirochaetota bacterium]HPI21691.1 metal ABC transporter permease [Spirochaetota bacterium]